MFLVNGFMIGNWAPKIPEFVQRLSLTESELGLMILALGVGALCAMPVAGWLIAKLGSARILKLAALTAVPAMIYITVPDGKFAAAFALFALGACIAAMDVSMNANAVSVERSIGRPIMSSCHGFWSLGGLAGAATGGWFIEMLGLMGHAFLVTALAALAIAISWHAVLEDRTFPTDATPAAIRMPANLLPYLLGMMALFSMVPEGAVLDWGALFLRQELGVSVEQSGFGFAAFSGAMAIMRFAGDSVRLRLGAVATIRGCAAVAVCGLVLAGQASSPVLVIAGFALCGIGISNMVPILFSAAGNLPGLAPGIGISIVTFMGYSGILFAPSLIGFIAEYTGLGPIFSFLPVLLVVVLAFSPLASHADHSAIHHGQEPQSR